MFDGEDALGQITTMSLDNQRNLKPADFFSDDDILYLKEDIATGEIRLSILWEWLHKTATLTEDAPETGAKAGGHLFTRDLFTTARRRVRQVATLQEQGCSRRLQTETLPIARQIVATYVSEAIKTPWHIDLLNLNLNNQDLKTARERVERYVASFQKDGTRITENLDFDSGHASERRQSN